jgi:hypothetical protein
VRRVRLSEDVVHRSFGAETVLLNLKTGDYHGVRGSGGRMLELLVETGDVDETSRRIAEEFKQPVDAIARDLDELCDGLRDRQLLEDA